MSLDKENDEYDGGDDGAEDDLGDLGDEDVEETFPDEDLAAADIDASDEKRGDKTIVEGEENEEAEEEEEEVEEERVETTKYVKEVISVNPKDFITSDILNDFEMTELISVRSADISNRGGPVFVDVSDLDNPVKMAKRELMMRKFPLIVSRYIGERKNQVTKEIEKVYEYRNPNTMIFSRVYSDVM